MSDAPPPPPPPPSANPGGPTPQRSEANQKKILCGILGIVLGTFGVHKFVLGYTQEGIIMVAVAIVGGIVTCGIGASAISIIGLIEGIIYLTKSDDEFYDTYMVNKRPWF